MKLVSSGLGIDKHNINRVIYNDMKLQRYFLAFSFVLIAFPEFRSSYKVNVFGFIFNTQSIEFHLLFFFFFQLGSQ